jgi:hypothetical protein
MSQCTSNYKNCKNNFYNYKNYKNAQHKKGMAEVVESLPSKNEALSSSPSTVKKKKEN